MFLVCLELFGKLAPWHLVSTFCILDQHNVMSARVSSRQLIFKETINQLKFDEAFVVLNGCCVYSLLFFTCIGICAQ